jgi:hypothetical protein
VVGVEQDLQVGVGVHVDEAGRDDQAGGVDRSRGRRIGDQVGAVTDPGDPRAADRDVGAVARFAGAVDDGAAGQDQIGWARGGGHGVLQVGAGRREPGSAAGQK